MARKVFDKEYLENNREDILQQYKEIRPRNKKLRQLTKKERKVLGIGKDEGRATVKNVRYNSFKVNAVIRLIRGKSLDEAQAILSYLPQPSARILAKLIDSAEANAVNNNSLSRDDLVVAECFANEGPIIKRIRARARGSATRILKRTSHITVVLRERG